MSEKSHFEPTTEQLPMLNRPLVVGVWLVLPAGLHWRGEGIGRTIEWVIQGFKEAGLLGRHVVFKIAVSIWIRGDIERSMRQLLGDLEGIEFITYSTRRYRVIMAVDRIFSLNGYIKFNEFWLQDSVRLTQLLNGELVPEDDSSGEFDAEARPRFRLFDKDKPTYRRLSRNLAEAKTLGISKVRDTIASEFNFPPAPTPFVVKNFFSMAEHNLRKRYLSELRAYRKAYWPAISKKLIEETATPPLLPGIQVFNKVVKLLRRIPILSQMVGLTMRFVHPFLAQSELLGISRFANRIDKAVPVDTWWVPSPNISGAEYLKKPVVANFWDFVIGEFGFLWDEKSLDSIYHRVKMILHKSTEILTQSHHNKTAKLVNGFMVEPEKATICYLTVPKSYPQHVPTFAETGKRSVESRLEADTIIKTYLRRKMYLKTDERVKNWRRGGLDIERLLGFPFHTAKYAICSTQARPYKNLDFLVDTYLWMIEKYNLDVYLFLTSEFDISDKNDPIGKIIWKRRMIDRVFSLHRVPNKVHAALYHNATCTLHPSFTEGGVGSYPFLEGMVMGTPGLVAEGEYSREGYRLHPNYDEVFMSATNRKKAAEKIAKTLADRDGAFERQGPIFEAHNAWQWEDVARVYADAMFRAAGARTPPDVTAPLQLAGKNRYFEKPDTVL